MSKSFKQRWIHFDLKGAPPNISYFKQLIRMISDSDWGATGIVLEYEDTFPYNGELSCLQNSESYRPEDLRALLNECSNLGISVVPLVQTFGHFEFVLKHEQFKRIREVDKYPMSLCPNNKDSMKTVLEMVHQVMEFHGQLTHFHIGGDETYHIGSCNTCQQRIKDEKFDCEDIYLDYMTRLLMKLKDLYPNVTFIMWRDMLANTSEQKLKDSGIAGLVEIMVWQYFNSVIFPKGMWRKFGNVFHTIWAASAYKGATGPGALVTDIGYHIENQKSWLNEMQKQESLFKKGFQGCCLTGWQRYDHYACLCDLLPCAIPCLAICLRILRDGEFTPLNHQEVSASLKFNGLMPINLLDASLKSASSFPGSRVYQDCFQLYKMFFEYEALVKNERMQFWMTDYHVSHRYANPAHIEAFLPAFISFFTIFEKLEQDLRSALSKLYGPQTVNEWIQQNFTPRMNKLKTVIANAELLLKCGALPSPAKTSDNTNCDPAAMEVS